MIPNAPQNKSASAPASAKPRLRQVDVPSAAEIDRLKAEFLEVTASGAAPVPVVGPMPPPARKVVGTGNCPKCARYGEITVEGEGYSRKMVYSGCVCPRTK